MSVGLLRSIPWADVSRDFDTAKGATAHNWVSGGGSPPACLLINLLHHVNPHSTVAQSKCQCKPYTAVAQSKSQCTSHTAVAQHNPSVIPTLLLLSAVPSLLLLSL